MQQSYMPKIGIGDPHKDSNWNTGYDLITIMTALNMVEEFNNIFDEGAMGTDKELAMELFLKKKGLGKIGFGIEIE